MSTKNHGRIIEAGTTYLRTQAKNKRTDTRVLVESWLADFYAIFTPTMPKAEREHDTRHVLARLR